MQNANLQYRMDTEQFIHDTLLQEYVDDCGELPAMQLAALSNQLIAKYHIAQGRALHLGCATGRTTFALATFFKQVMCDFVMVLCDGITFTVVYKCRMISL